MPQRDALFPENRHALYEAHGNSAAIRSDGVMAVKNEVFARAPYPNWTAVGVNWLAGFDFEIKVIVRVPAKP